MKYIHTFSMDAIGNVHFSYIIVIGIHVTLISNRQVFIENLGSAYVYHKE